MKPIAALLLPLAFLLTACNSSDNGRAQALQSEIDALTQKQFETQQAAKRLQGQIEASRLERTKLETERDKVSAERDAAKKEVEQMKKEFENYKTLYKVSIRRRAPGMKLEDFAIDGKVFQQVTMLELTESTVNFTHNAGVKKIELKQLPFHLQAILGFSEPEDTPREVAVSSTLTTKQVRDKNRLELDAADDYRRSIQDKVFEAKKRLSAARAQKQTLAARQQPLLPLVQYIEQMELTLRRLELQLSEADLNRHEVVSKQRTSYQN